MEKRLRWYWKCPSAWRSWRVDETYVKVKGRWTYLYRAVDKNGATVDFYLSATRSAKAGKRFLGKALKDWEKPVAINTDKAPHPRRGDRSAGKRKASCPRRSCTDRRST